LTPALTQCCLHGARKPAKPLLNNLLTHPAPSGMTVPDRGIWSDVEVVTGRAAAQQWGVSGLVQARRDGRADRTRSDDCNAYTH